MRTKIFELSGRYWLFTGVQYYPCGGMSDFKGTYNSVEDAKNALDDVDEWHEVLDSATGEIVS